jgi:hypothetical protein
MSEEREVAEAVVAVEPEPSEREHARLRRGDKLKSTAAVLTALAALIAATGAFLKTFDHSVTESAYNTLSESIVKLSDRQQKTTEDVAMLRGYLEGLSRAPMPAPVMDAGVASRDAGRTRQPLPAVAPSAPPAVAPSAPPVRPPSFSAAISTKE